MTDNEYMTVKDFAEAAGVTTQYVYKLLGNKLQPFTNRENGKTLISAEALSLFSGNETSQETDKQQTIDNLLIALQQQLSIKDEQLANKDRQIANLDERLKEAHVLAREAQEKIPLLAAPAEPPQTVPEQPVKLKWYQRLFVRRKSTK